jgi:hypothetical protein
MGVAVIRCLAIVAVLLAGASDAAAQKPQSKSAPPARAAPPPAPAPAKAPTEPVKTSDDIKRESIKGAATAPLRDLNVMRAEIPELLLQAMADPYARPPRNYKCPQLIALIRPLDDILGPDIDRVNIEDQDMMDRGKSTALGTAADLASGAIPFRGVVRKLSGAEKHDRLVRDAITAGAVRRAYLKGLGEAKGCNPPATPSHERAGMTMSEKGKLKPQYPVRGPAAQQRISGAPPTAPRR